MTSTVNQKSTGNFERFHGSSHLAATLIPITKPGAQLSPNSKIPATALGKAPGKPLADGTWHGYPWRKAPPATLEQARAYDAAGANVGIRCGDQVTIFDSDVTDPKISKEIDDLATATFSKRPPKRTVSRPGHNKFSFAFRVVDPFSNPAPPPSRDIKFTGPDGQPQGLQVLGRGKQSVCAGQHPLGGEYQWDQDIVADGPLEVTREEFDAFIAAAVELLEVHGCTITSPLAGTNGVGAAGVDRGIPMPCSEEELRDLMKVLKNDETVDYDKWVAHGHAMYGASEGKAFPLWEDWCSAQPQQRGLEEAWNSFKNTHTGAVTLRKMMWERDPNKALGVTQHWAKKAFPPILDLDDSALAEDEAPPEEQPEHIEQADIELALLDPQGLVGEIADWSESAAIAPCRVHAVGAGLAVVGAIIQREVFTQEVPTGAHLYYAVIAATGSGKQQKMEAIKLALDEASGSLHPSIHDGWKTSAAMLLTSLAECPTRLQIVDEFADKLAGLKQSTGSNEATHLSETYREFWGTGTGNFMPSEARSRRVPAPLVRPALSFWGAATTAAFTKMMSAQIIANGLLNRFLLLPRFERPPVLQHLPSGILAVPTALAAKLKALFASANGGQLPDYQSKSPRYLVPMTPQALDLDYENRLFQSNQLRLSDEHFELVLYARYAEMIKRIALIVACGKAHSDLSKAVIDEPEMRFARGLVAWSVGQMIVLAREHMAENENHAVFKRVRGLIFKAGTTGIKHSELSYKLGGHVRRRDLVDTIEQLKEGKQIAAIKGKSGATGGAPGIVYRAILKRR